MKKEDPKEEAQPVEVNRGERCGPEPKNPGGTGPGDWQCRDNEWVWVSDIGGG